VLKQEHHGHHKKMFSSLSHFQPYFFLFWAKYHEAR
jgi:hypothetical protein